MHNQIVMALASSMVNYSRNKQSQCNLRWMFNSECSTTSKDAIWQGRAEPDIVTNANQVR